MVVVEGTPARRIKHLDSEADIYLINPEQLVWLAKQNYHFDDVVVDESTRFKGFSSKRFKALSHLIWKSGCGDRNRTIMTGTPIAKNVIDMWAQVYLLDRGERLGKNITAFRREFCYQGGFKGREWLPKSGAEEKVAERIGDIMLRQDNDNLDMPELIVNDIMIDKPRGEFSTTYDRLQKDFLMEGEMADNAGVVYGMLRQLVGGEVYGRSVKDSSKLDRLESLVEELSGKPLLVAYHFKHEAERIREKFGDVPVINSSESANRHVDNWNKKAYNLMLIQPAACAYGLNLQDGGSDLCWFTLTNSAEQYNQTNARLFRQGQGSQVRIHRLLMRGTVDLATRRLLETKVESGNLINETIKFIRSEL